MYSGQRGEVASCSTRSLGPFVGHTIANSKEGDNTPTFQETCWKATKTNGKTLISKREIKKRPLMMQTNQNQQRKGIELLTQIGLHQTFGL